jgi:hypothetical protein
VYKGSKNGAIVDSGSSQFALPDPAYTSLKKAVEAAIDPQVFAQAPKFFDNPSRGGMQILCGKGYTIDGAIIGMLPTLMLQMQTDVSDGGKMQMCVPPGAYLVRELIHS